MRSKTLPLSIVLFALVICQQWSRANANVNADNVDSGDESCISNPQSQPQHHQDGNDKEYCNTNGTTKSITSNNSKPKEKEKAKEINTDRETERQKEKEWRELNEQCKVWVGMSTLPGTGIGMFAGQLFRKGDLLMKAGDHIIPIIDRDLHTRTALVDDYDDNDYGNDISSSGGGRSGNIGFHSNMFFLWDQYTWNGDALHIDSLGVAEIQVASPGFGATANSFMDFVNVEEGYQTRIPPSSHHILHRSTDPQAGAFTPFHSRMSTAKQNIQPGQEFFVSYGNNWFISRQNEIGPIPIQGDHDRAFALYQTFQQVKKNSTTTRVSNNDKNVTTFMFQELWETLVLNHPFASTSSILKALPTNQSEYFMMERLGLIQMKKNQMVRSMDWLHQHALCADHVHSGPSTIPKAGMGVFASRLLPANRPILPIPLIHIPHERVLNMYKIAEGTRNPIANRTHGIEGKQLLLNYCLGHANSTVLLSPYGPIFNMINHNQTQANVKLQWALPERSNHHPELLERPAEFLEAVKGSKLAMELITFREIQPNEELFLDYGDLWEEAWQEHLQQWSPGPEAKEYRSASQWDESPERLRTEFEQMKNPYPGNVGLRFNRKYSEYVDSWRQIWNNDHPHHYRPMNALLREWETKQEHERKVGCEILRYRYDDLGRILYTAVIAINDDSTRFQRVQDMPREAFSFDDRPYTTDMFLPTAFRHAIQIPDELFPSAWKNKQ